MTPRKPRDPAKTLRNQEISRLTSEIKKLLPEVLKVTGYKSEASLNGTYGGKHREYVNTKDSVIETPEQFFTKYLSGFLKVVEEQDLRGNTIDAYVHVIKNPVVYEWLRLFLHRTFLKEYEALSKVRPSATEAEIWIGQENASYGILITPFFHKGKWINDESEIRHFQPNYWTIGHVLETGLVIPDDDERIEFKEVKDYLSFFKNTLVRNSGSKHEKEIAKRYCDYVERSAKPEDVPLLIPELRYEGAVKKHKYRLDFTIISYHNMNKIGFEFSPWSTHGKLSGTKDKTQTKINQEAQENFEREMKKQKAYFRKFGITVLIYTDSDFKDYDAIFEDISKFLSPTKAEKQLGIEVVKEFFAFGRNK